VAGYNQYAILRARINANKRQKALINASKNASVYFFESRLFKGLQAFGVKNFSWCSNLAKRVVSTADRTTIVDWRDSSTCNKWLLHRCIVGDDMQQNVL
jgi:hypothetical protein